MKPEIRRVSCSGSGSGIFLGYPGFSGSGKPEVDTLVNTPFVFWTQTVSMYNVGMGPEKGWGTYFLFFNGLIATDLIAHLCYH